MVCPDYRGKKECGIHSKFYELTKETIKKYCKGDYFSCKERLENNKKPLRSSPRITEINDTYTSIAAIVKRETSISFPLKKERLELKCNFSWLKSIAP